MISIYIINVTPNDRRTDGQINRWTEKHLAILPWTVKCCRLAI